MVAWPVDMEEYAVLVYHTASPYAYAYPFDRLFDFFLGNEIV